MTPADPEWWPAYEGLEHLRRAGWPGDTLLGCWFAQCGPPRTGLWGQLHEEAERWNAGQFPRRHALRGPVGHLLGAAPVEREKARRQHYAGTTCPPEIVKTAAKSDTKACMAVLDQLMGSYPTPPAPRPTQWRCVKLAAAWYHDVAAWEAKAIGVGILRLHGTAALGRARRQRSLSILDQLISEGRQLAIALGSAPWALFADELPDDWRESELWRKWLEAAELRSVRITVCASSTP